MSNIIKLTGFQLNNKKFNILGWTVGSFAMMFLYMILFASMQDLGQAKLDNLPKEVLQFMGVESFNIMTDWIAYFGMIFGLFVLVLSIYAATFTGSVFYGEEKSKSIEFLDALPVSRTEVYISKVLTSFIALLSVLVSMTISAAICGTINGGETFIMMDMLTIIRVSSFTIFFFLAVSCFSGGFNGKVSAAMVGAVVGGSSYMIGYLARLLEDRGEVLSYFSPFVLFEPTRAITMENNTVVALVIYFVIFVGLILAGGYFYKRRDFHI